MQKQISFSVNKKIRPSLSLPFLTPIHCKKNKRLSNKANILNFFIKAEEDKIKQICDFDTPDSFFSMECMKSQQLIQEQRRKTISNQLIYQSSSNNYDGTFDKDKEIEANKNAQIKNEKDQTKEINDLETKINLLKDEYNTKTSQISSWTLNIENSMIELKALHTSNNRNNSGFNSSKNHEITSSSVSKNQKETNLIKRMTNLETTIRTLKDLVKQLKFEVKNIEALIKKLKVQLNKKKNIMIDYYHNMLLEGKDSRSEGLVWIIKAIWSLDADVQMKYIPTFLDEKAIDYLFLYSKKADIHKKLVKEIKEIKDNLSQKNKHKLFSTNISKPVNRDYLSNSISHKDKIKPIDLIHKLTQSSIKDEHLEQSSFCSQLRKPMSNFDEVSLNYISKLYTLEKSKNELLNEMNILKEKEMKRITKEYLKNNYEKRFKVPQEEVISALIGEENKDKEFTKQRTIRKEYIKKIKMCHFYKSEDNTED